MRGLSGLLFALNLVIAGSIGCEKPGQAEASTEDEAGQEDEGAETGDDEGGEADEDDPSSDGECSKLIECTPGKDECGKGRKCAPYRCGEGCCTNATRCVDLMGEKEAGEDCFRDGKAQLDDCGVLLHCTPTGGSTGEGGPGTCQQLCILPERGASDNHCKELGFPDRTCMSFNQGSYPACAESCDPLLQECDNPDHGCYLASSDYFCTEPLEDAARVKEECVTEQGCKPGLLCAGAQLVKDCELTSCGEADNCGCCAMTCDLDRGDADCPEDEVCSKIFARPPLGTENAGVCTVPQ